MAKRDSEYFRAAAGAVIFERTATRILVLRRADVEEEAWQLPQGGIKQGESPRDALVREVAEEVGLTEADYDVEREHDDWLAYELPPDYRSAKTGRGQVQKWYLLRLKRDDVRIEPDGVEFDRARWVSPGELVALAPPFRRPVYRRLVEWVRQAGATATVEAEPDGHV